MMYEIRANEIAGQHEFRNVGELRDWMAQNEVPDRIRTRMLANFEKRGAPSSTLSSGAQIDAQNRTKAAGFQFIKDDAKVDAANRAAVARLAAEVRNDGAEDDDPDDSEESDDQEEFHNALHDMSVASWDEKLGKLYTSENSNSEMCSYDYSRDDDTDAICIDRSSRKVIS
jgi:hypothetical protein